MIEQTAVNLSDNAVKYSPPNNTVAVEALDTGRAVHIRFIDHGPGIAAKHLPCLFERFYRVDKARSRQLGGTGLGLAIVKHILLAHGGQVNVDSTPGKGSTFNPDAAQIEQPARHKIASSTPRRCPQVNGSCHLGTQGSIL